MRILFIGDIVGKPGRELIRRGLPTLIDHHSIDIVIANAENSAAGFGITREIGQQLLDWGIGVMTSGNHIWDKREALDYIGTEPRLIRPANYPAGAPGNGSYLARTDLGETIGVINVMGRVFMLNIDDPFAVVQREIEKMRERTRTIFVDFHAEATSEKIAMGWHLDGRVSAVVGTHTHVQTADERILPKGTAYLTDVGMTGPHDSIIGVEVEPALSRFLTGLPSRFETATGNPRLNAVIVETDPQTGRAVDIERLSVGVDDSNAQCRMSDLFDLPFEEDDADAAPAVAEVQPSRTAVPRTAVGSAAGKSAGKSVADGVVKQSPLDPRRPTATAQPYGVTTPRSVDAEPPIAPVAKRRILSVTELTLGIRDLLETEFFEVWVEGEISNARVWNTGHLYFTLKDSGAQVRGVIFRSALRYLKFKPADGLRVVARGRISVYEPKGEYQLVCEHLEPHGLGALQLAFDQLKKKLQQEGLFDAARKRPLPALPRKIGIVTSLDGAAIRDIINVLGRRYANAHLVIRPARVQGDGAALEIARALRAIGRLPGVDVIIVGRGGGSIEDLWAFNEEIVARAIGGSPVPVISAVGHETDVTIADFVADLRAPTPSAAAEMVVVRKDEFRARIDRLAGRLTAMARQRVHALSRAVHLLSGRPAFSGVPGRVAMRGRHAAELTHALARELRATLTLRHRRVQQLQRQLDTFDPGRRLGGIRARLITADGRLAAATRRVHHRADARLRECASRLDTLSPLAVLGRGYAVCWAADGERVLRASTDVDVGDSVRVALAKGELDCIVQRTTTLTDDVN